MLKLHNLHRKKFTYGNNLRFQMKYKSFFVSNANKNGLTWQLFETIFLLSTNIITLIFEMILYFHDKFDKKKIRRTFINVWGYRKFQFFSKTIYPFNNSKYLLQILCDIYHLIDNSFITFTGRNKHWKLFMIKKMFIWKVRIKNVIFFISQILIDLRTHQIIELS